MPRMRQSVTSLYGRAEGKILDLSVSHPDAPPPLKETFLNNPGYTVSTAAITEPLDLPQAGPIIHPVDPDLLLIRRQAPGYRNVAMAWRRDTREVVYSVIGGDGGDAHLLPTAAGFVAFTTDLFDRVSQYRLYDTAGNLLSTINPSRHTMLRPAISDMTIVGNMQMVYSGSGNYRVDRIALFDLNTYTLRSIDAMAAIAEQLETNADYVPWSIVGSTRGVPYNAAGDTVVRFNYYNSALAVGDTIWIDGTSYTVTSVTGSAVGVSPALVSDARFATVYAQQAATLIHVEACRWGITGSTVPITAIARIYVPVDTADPSAGNQERWIRLSGTVDVVSEAWTWLHQTSLAANEEDVAVDIVRSPDVTRQAMAHHFNAVDNTVFVATTPVAAGAECVLRLWQWPEMTLLGSHSGRRVFGVWNASGYKFAVGHAGTDELPTSGGASGGRDLTAPTVYCFDDSLELLWQRHTGADEQGITYDEAAQELLVTGGQAATRAVLVGSGVIMANDRYTSDAPPASYLPLWYAR